MVEVWDTRTLGLLATLEHGAGGVVEAGFSQDAQRLYTLDESGRLRLWFVPSARTPFELSMHTIDEGHSFAQFSPNDRLPTGAVGRPYGIHPGRRGRDDADTSSVD